MLVLVGLVLAQAFPSTEAVRLRNALLIVPADPSAGDWSPENAPASFLAEKLPIPGTIASAALKVVPGTPGSDLDRARALAGHLLVHVKDKGPIQSTDVEASYRKIIEEGRGYCADVIDAYLALALAAQLSVRPWAFSFDGYGGHGHIVVEVYDRALAQWIMLDIYNNVMPQSVSGKPLSVRQFVPLFKSHETDIEFVPIGAGRVAYAVDEKLRAYYRRGIDQWYLWNGNNIVSRGRSGFLVAWSGAVFEPLGELAAIALGQFPRIVPMSHPAAGGHVDKMFALRTRLIAMAAAFGVLALLLVAQIAILWRRAWHPTESRRRWRHRSNLTG